MNVETLPRSRKGTTRMLKRPAFAGLTAAALAGGAFAHGDGAPSPVDTKGLPPLGDEQPTVNPYRAAELGLCGSTVKTHVSEIIRKLGVISRTQIVIETARLDLESMHRAVGH